MLPPDFSHPKLEKSLGPLVPNSYIIKFKHGTLREEKKKILQLDKFVEFLHLDYFLFPAHSSTPDHDTLFEKAAKLFRGEDSSSSEVDSKHFNAAVGILNQEDLKNVLNSLSVVLVSENGIVQAHGENQSDAPWGISRLSFKDPVPSISDAMRSRFPYQWAELNNKVDVYVVDTGIDANHSEFRGRVRYLTVRRDNGRIKITREWHPDCQGHGTHVAGTIGGTRYGVAKTCNLISVNVMLPNPIITQTSDLLQTLTQLVAEIFMDQLILGNLQETVERLTRSVVNLSLITNRSTLIDGTVNFLIGIGLHVVAAAGNQGNDAQYFSPAGVESVITVGASTFTNSRAWFSNTGSLVDIYAPGVFTTSAAFWPGIDESNTTEAVMMSGTSMACAHVSGLVAYLISVEGGRTPAKMKDRLIKLALKDVLSDIPIGSNNRLANFSDLGNSLLRGMNL